MEFLCKLSLEIQQVKSDQGHLNSQPHKWLNEVQQIPFKLTTSFSSV